MSTQTPEELYTAIGSPFSPIFRTEATDSPPPNTMSVRQLQKALDDANINWSDCIEKQDLVQKLTQWRGTLAHQQTEDQPEQETTERAVEADTQQPAARKEHEAPSKRSQLSCLGKL